MWDKGTTRLNWKRETVPDPVEGAASPDGGTVGDDVGRSGKEGVVTN